MKSRVVWVVAMVASTLSCGGDAACVPGEQVECACPGGDTGAQACNADGSGFEACSCDGENPSGGTGAFAPMDPCEAYAQAATEKIEECDLEVSGGAGEGGATPCTEELQVQATCLKPCIEDVPCAAISGDDPAAAEAYLDCVTGCA